MSARQTLNPDLLSPDRIRRLAVARFSAIGDLVRLAPALHALRTHWPEAEIDFIVASGFEAVMDGCPYIDNVVVYNRIPGLRGIPGFFRFCASLRRKRYDLLVDLHDNTRSRRMADLAAPVLRTPSLDKENIHLPLMRQYEEFLKRIYVDIVDPDTLLWLSDAQLLYQAGFRGEHLDDGAPAMGFCIVGSWQTKHWPATHFSTLGMMLERELGVRIVLLGGRAEAETAATIAAEIGPAAINLAGKTTIAQSIAVAGLCAAVVSNDSGLMHAAAALGTPTIGLFGCTSADSYGPAGPRATALTAGVPCSPCHKSECSKSALQCMQNIMPEQVFRVVSEYLKTGES
jgi:heptosyltransferase-2